MIERFFVYSQRVQLAASETRYMQRLEIRENAPFYLRGLGFAVSSGAVTARLCRADGSYFTGNDFFHLDALCNTGMFARPTPIAPQIYYPPSGAFVYDLRDIGGAGDTNIYPVLIGVERYPDGALPGPAYPDLYREEPYEISIAVSLSGLDAQTLNLPVRCETGEAFAIRSLAWRSDDTLATPTTMAVRWRDEYGRLFMNDWVPLRKLFSGPTDADAPYLFTPFPEQVIPANGAYTIDLWNRTEAGPFTIELVFGGVKLIAFNPQTGESGPSVGTNIPQSFPGVGL